jgi:hypothetical protein
MFFLSKCIASQSCSLQKLVTEIDCYPHSTHIRQRRKVLLVPTFKVVLYLALTLAQLWHLRSTCELLDGGYDYVAEDADLSSKINKLYILRR